jgi:RNA polymerase sigma-70 factor (ECF subfamily)
MSVQGSGFVTAEDDRGAGSVRFRSIDADSVDLAATLISVAQGDDRALSVLQKHLSEPLHRVARRIVRSHECAQEIVCDVFVYVWKNAKTYDVTKGTVTAWLTRVTRNRAIDRLRSSRRHRLVNERLSLAAAAIDFEPPDDVLTHFQNALSLHQAIRSLSSLRQHLLTLSFFDDLSHEEISSRIDLPLGTVKSHLRRALQVLHSKLERDRRSEGYPTWRL